MRSGAGIGVSIVAIVVGAILRYAVFGSPSWISLQLTGLVLLIVGGIGLGASVAVAIAASLTDRDQARGQGYQQGRADAEAHWEREVMRLRQLSSVEQHDRYEQGRADERAQSGGRAT
jgi:hypothetical protein